MRPWLFRIAHNAALDFLRKRERRRSEPLDAVPEPHAGDESQPERELLRRESVGGALTGFLRLPPRQRSCVIPKDVPGHTLQELSGMLGMSLPAVKAALHRGRSALGRAVDAPGSPDEPVPPALERYARLFNARDWDAVRAMLVEDVRLELVSHHRAEGVSRVARYFTNYDGFDDWHLVPGRVDGRPALAVFRSPARRRPAYFVEIGLRGDRIVSIRDYRFVPYIARDATFTPA